VQQYEAGWQGDFVRLGVEYDRYQKGFDPKNGLIKTDRLGTDSRAAFASFFRTFGPQWISEVNFDVVRSLRETDDGRDQNDSWYTGGSVEWAEFMRSTVSYYHSDYRPTTGDEPGEFSDTVNEDRYWSFGLDFNTRSSRIGYGASLSTGDLGGDDYEYLFGYLWARPTPNTSVSFTAERLESFGVFKQYITEAGWDVTSTSSFIFRHISADSDDYWRFGYRRVATEGLDIFLLYDDDPFNDAQLSLKLLWIL
jgi:hypothetical protein